MELVVFPVTFGKTFIRRDVKAQSVRFEIIPVTYDFITVKGCSHTPTYRSTDEEVVSVDEAGNVEAEGEGTATIIVRVHGKTLKCKVRVEGVSVDDEESFSDDEEEEEDEDEDYYGY